MVLSLRSLPLVSHHKTDFNILKMRKRAITSILHAKFPFCSLGLLRTLLATALSLVISFKMGY